MAERFFSQNSDDAVLMNMQTLGITDAKRCSFTQNDCSRISQRCLGNYTYRLQNTFQASAAITANQQYHIGSNNGCLSKNRYAPYISRAHSTVTLGSANASQSQHLASFCSTHTSLSTIHDRFDSSATPTTSPVFTSDQNHAITLQINNLDYSLDEGSLRHFLLNQLKPITPVLSLVFEGTSYARVTVPDLYCAKQVVANLHRKKIGHKRMVVSYTRDSSLTDINTLRCQVAGLLKDVPYCTLPMYKFRELFQSRFKTSINVLDLYKMQDICNITTDKNEEKYISLNPDLINSIENSPLIKDLQHSVPYCTIHFKREQHKGWAEQDIEPLPNVFMTLSEIQNIIYPLLKRHSGDIPVTSLVHCINGELGFEIVPNENGVNLEHLICCIHGIQIITNNFGIKILAWLEPEHAIGKDSGEGRVYAKNGLVADPLYQISREVIELLKMSPKSTMKFNRFIPAYHNHFGKQCRVADYGYTRLIELFEALSSVVQIMGDGENRQITLTHRAQIRRFTSDLLRILRSQGNKSILLSQLPKIFAQSQNRTFDVTDYGICDIVDILDGLVNSNTVVVSSVQNDDDILISIPKRKQTLVEIERTSIFANEVIELLRNAPQYSIQFQKFVRSYHYHFGYQCRLSDYGFLKLADLMEAIQGVVEIDYTNDEDKRIYLSPKVSRRVFAEQLEEIIKECTGFTKNCMKLDEILKLHKKKFGYQITAQTLGFEHILDAIKILPYIELLETDKTFWIISHSDDIIFRNRCYKACKIIQDSRKESIAMKEFIELFATKYKENLSEHTIAAMKHALEIRCKNDIKYVSLSPMMQFLLRIIKLLEQNYMSLSEIKTVMKIGIGDCFDFGYANLFSLLRAYPDLFVVEIGSTEDRKVGLVAQGDLVLKVPYNIPRIQHSGNKTKQDKKQNGSLADNMQQTLDGKQSNSIIQNFEGNPFESKSVQNNLHFRDGCSNNLVTTSWLYNSDSTSCNAFNVSLNSSLGSDPNSSYGSVNSVNGTVGGVQLWDRCKAKSFTDSSDILQLINSTSTESYYKPKSNTLISETLPFWIDPIWTNNAVEISPKLESLNINLPEMKSLKFLPMLMSPYSLSKSENMKRMFSFDEVEVGSNTR